MNSKQRSVIGIFLLLIVVCAGLVIGGDFLGPSAGIRLLEMGGEGFKISVAALVGALSAILGGGTTNAK